MVSYLKLSCFILYFTIVGFGGHNLFACGCIQKMDVSNQVQHSDFVVVAKVKFVRDSIINDSLYPNYSEAKKIKVIYLSLKSILKGDNQNETNVTLLTPASDEECGFEFKINKKYIIYGSIKEVFPFTRTSMPLFYYTSKCYRTRLYSKKEIADIKRVMNEG